ncbi:hypothetical protein GIB67_038017 [Kingdonia uniflora]|uniref:Uncharacterized protein n=1 Tax=Kingdonia uniflora TaxID=39325 RepID=A0A7J7LHN0_9MAGN|nr:hypothetical protein GIB67_038017 [Kingdonia uniflora]
MEEKLSSPELNTPLKLARLNEITDGPVDVATVSSTVVRNQAKRKAIKRGAAPRSVTSGANLRLRFEIQAGLLEEQCRAKAQEKMVVVMDDEFKKFARALRDVQLGFQDRGAFQLEREKEREAATLKLKEVRAESEAEAERLVTSSAISRNNLAGKLYQLRYTKSEIMAFSKGNYERMEIMDEEEVEEREDGLNVAEKTAVNNQETINQEIESSRLRFEDLEGLLKVEKKSSAELDLALNQLANELAELKEKTASGSRHEAELAEYRIRALNEEISDMKCNIRALNDSIMGKDRELCNSAQIRDSLIAKLDRVKADLRRLKGREAQNRANLAEIQAKNKSLVDDLAYARGNVRRAVQRENEMNERINQLCARISESEQELCVREMKYQKDLKFELDKRDGEIVSGEGSREMKEFLRQKEELVENMRIDLTNSRQKSIDLTRKMSERIDQLTVELNESKARRLKDNKHAAVTHQAFKEIVVRKQEKCDGEALHQYKLSALVAF